MSRFYHILSESQWEIPGKIFHLGIRQFNEHDDADKEAAITDALKSLDRAIIKLMEVHNISHDKFKEDLHVCLLVYLCLMSLQKAGSCDCWIIFCPSTRHVLCSSLTLATRVTLAEASPLMSTSLNFGMKPSSGLLLAVRPRHASGKVYIASADTMEDKCMHSKPGMSHFICCSMIFLPARCLGKSTYVKAFFFAICAICFETGELQVK